MKDLNLVGIDEAGRGTLAGSLFMAACKFKNSTSKELILSLKDSKKLSEKRRFELARELKKQSAFLILAFSSALIDEKGLSFCLKKGLEIIQRHFSNSEFLFDGNTNFGQKRVQTLIKADSKIAEVSAASILAKASKDEEMLYFEQKFPNYEFAKHKGYASRVHLDKITRFGLCEIHRKSFKLKALEKNLLSEL